MTVPMPTQENIRKMGDAGISARQIATRTGLSRNTVAKYLDKQDYSPTPLNIVSKSLVDDYAHIVEEWFANDLKLPRKQRHTAKRVHDRLVTEHDFKGSYWSVARWVKKHKQSQRLPGDGFSELVWAPGAAQADFGEAEAVIAGQKVTIHLLLLTLPFSNARFMVALPGETAECVSEGLKTIFEHIGSVPHTIVFDNATGVGRKLAKGETVMARMFEKFRLHYGFNVIFTNPNSGNEKGNVENAVGFLRRNLMVPIPHVETMSGLTTILLERCDNLLELVHYRKKEPLGELFKYDKKVMRPLPGISFDACNWVLRTVDLVGNVTVNDVKYFVASEHAGQRVQAGLRAFEIEILTLDKKHIITHKRVYSSSARTVRFEAQLLPGLIRKPSSIRNSPLRENLSAELLTYLDEGEHYMRRQFFEMLASATNICGFNTAEQILTEAVKTGRKLSISEIEMSARRASESQNSISHGEGPDLGVYDQFLGGVN